MYNNKNIISKKIQDFEMLFSCALLSIEKKLSKIFNKTLRFIKYVDVINFNDKCESDVLFKHFVKIKMLTE